MISTQLDLFGGPPKPPKNIREEEPAVGVPPVDDKAVELANEPEPEISEDSSNEPVLEVERDPVLEEMPEWIDEPAKETDAEIDGAPPYEPYQDVKDDPLGEYVLEKEEKTEDEPEDAESTYTEMILELEDEPDAVDTTFAEPTQEIEDERDLNAIEYDNEVTLDDKDLQDIRKDAEETFAAPSREDTVHVQMPSLNASPIIFSSLIPVEDFVVEEKTADEPEEIQEANSSLVEEPENEIPGLENDSQVLEMQDEDPLPPAFMIEAITKNDEVIGAEPEVDLEDMSADNGQETKEGQLQIPEDEKLFLRQYYTMRETSNMFGVNQSLLRYWENEFDVLKPKKNRKGDRYFRPEDIKNLELIYHLLKVRKFTIEGAREYIKSKKKVLDTFELVQRLEKLKGFLHELKTHL